MGFYDESENVDKYIEMCEGYDGSNLYQVLQDNLMNGARVLELGSGPGFDIPFLSEHYDVTGSDYSDEFINRCKEKFPDIPFMKIDALNIHVSEKFDCIYSNKVLHHLTESELAKSLSQQAEALIEGGIVAHTFWMGTENQEIEGMLFTYYIQDKLIDIISEKFEVIATLSYKEFEDSDSLFVIAKLKS